MNTDEILKSGIGNIDKKSNSLKPSKVTITAVTVKDKKNNGEVMDTPLIEFAVKHPDSENNIKISKVKQLINDKVYCSSTWFTVDSENKIQKDMPLSRLMEKLGITTLEEAVGKEIGTIEESETSHFLVFQAY